MSLHNVTASELRGFLTQAAGLIRRYGWWNCGLGDRSTGFCAIGALDEVYNTRDTVYGTRNVAVRWLELLTTQGSMPLHRWNDLSGNKELVIDYMLRGAETAERGVEVLKGYNWE